MRREQIERLYEQYGPALVAYGCSLTGRRATAEDLVQQVFLKLLHEGRVEPENPRGYLYRAVRNTALNAMRTAGREIELDPDNPWFAARAGPADGLANDALALQAALLELPEEQREVIVMHVWGELTFEEIAAVAEISANTAASRYRYGLSKLRERMKTTEAAVAALFLMATGLIVSNYRGGWQFGIAEPVAGSAVMRPAAMNEIGGKSIPDLELPGLDGSAVRLSKLRGEVLMVNFWATWCVPCQTEMPWLTQFQERYGAQGFQVVAISMDEDQSQCGPFIEQHGLEKLMVLLGNSHAADRFGGILGLPTSFLVDRDGVIVSKHPGLINRDAVEHEILDLIQRPATASRLLVSFSRFNRLMRENPIQLDAQLSAVSRGLLPNVERPGSTLGALSRQ